MQILRNRVSSPLIGSAFRLGALATILLGLVAVCAGLVRLLPWIFDPAVPLRVAAPFARGLLSLAIEAALLVGWPVGWALAGFSFVESGEARAVQALGERPAATIRRLFPQAALFVLPLAVATLAWGRDANEPGRVANELIAKARTSCETSSEPRVNAVPFTDLAWLCAPDRPPRLVGRGPGGLSVMFSAANADIAGDFRTITLSDSNVSLGGSSSEFRARVHVDQLELRGLAPWSRASNLPPTLRAFVFAITALIAGSLAVFLAITNAIGSRLAAVAIGASGPIAALAATRFFERIDARAIAYASVPLVAASTTAIVAVGLSYLPLIMRAARKFRQP